MESTEDNIIHPKKCHLLSLPAELREMIYGFVVQRKWPVMCYEISIISHMGEFEMPIALTCRQIREESREVFFKINRFEFNCDGGWSPVIPACIAQMRHITIASSDLPWDFFLDLRKGFVNYDLKLDEQSPAALKQASSKACERKVWALVASWAQEQIASGADTLTVASFKNLLKRFAVEDKREQLWAPSKF